MPSYTSSAYVVDTNILISFSIWRPISMCPDFWNRLSKTLEEGRWVLTDIVFSEINYPPELLAWCKQQKARSLIVSIPDECRERAVEIDNQFPMIEQATGKSTADTYIVAYAELHQLTIFTRESYRKSLDPNALYKIPDVCKQLNVRYVRSPESFLRGVGF